MKTASEHLRGQHPVKGILKGPDGPAAVALLGIDQREFDAYAVKADGTVTKFPVSTGFLTEPERQIIADGCLINYYRNNK